MLRMNDFPLADPGAIFEDEAARSCLVETGALPAGPGALASAEPAIAPNEVYDVERLRLIFYDNPYWGPYRGRLKRILTEPRYLDLRANFRHFERLYGAAIERRASAGGSKDFEKLYDLAMEREAARLEKLLTMLDHVHETRVETFS
jgi:hypothetical protein